MSFVPLAWKAEFETGVEEIDLQHRYFLRLINRLGEELATAKDERYRQCLLDELAKYATFHFVSEENIMFKFAYPGLAEHARLHWSLLDRLSSRATGRPVEELLDFLTEWFAEHTTKEDHLIGEYLADTGRWASEPRDESRLGAVRKPADPDR